MRRLSNWILLVIVLLTLLPYSPAQELAGHRKLVSRAVPEYPVLARSNKIHGAVKVEVLVAPDGTVKATDVLGGHPVLAKAAMDAVRQWRWEPGSRESREVVEVNFAP
jgi:TonB family protein